MSARYFKAIGAWVLTLTLLVAVTSVAQAADYRIRAGDTLRIEVLEDPSLNRDALVLPSGSFTFPQAGVVRGKGRTATLVAQSLAQALAPNFANTPTVYVQVVGLAERKPVVPRQPAPDPVIDTFIMGEIAKPGKLEVPPETTLLQLLAQAGGLTKFAADKRIELRRTDPRTGVVSVYRFSYFGRGKGPLISGSTVLQSGDVIVVPERRLFE